MSERERLAQLTPDEQRARLATLLQRKARGPRSYPLSFVQERLWFLSQLIPDNAVYNVPAGVRLSGPLDVEILARSLNEIVRRHDVLRTTFERDRDGSKQIVAPSLTIHPVLCSLVDLPVEQRETEARRLTNEEARTPFDLTRGPLIRALIVRLDASDHLFLLTMHHAVSEMWSIALLFRELEQIYEAFSNGRPSPLQDLPIQYADYSVWQRQWLNGEVLATQLDYWGKQLGGRLPILDLPTDRPRPTVQTFNGAWFSTVYPEPLTAALGALSRRENATLFMTALAAFVTLLRRYTGDAEIIVGSPVAGRTRSELEPLIGMFINTVALRQNLSGNPSFRELIGRVREVVIGALSHQEVPFEKVLEQIRPERELSRTPVFQVMFALQNAPTPHLHLAGQVSGRVLQPDEIHNAGSKVDLALFMHETPQGMTVGFEYNTDLFEAATIERMARHFERLMEGVVSDPDQRIDALPLLTAAERHQLVETWNETATDYPRDRCIHQLVEAVAARAPETVAVVDGDDTVTYGELNARANQLAHHLLALGVGPEVPVAICLERSPILIVGLLGILKAGGSYVPLDPNYPADRLAFMLSDTQTPVLVTQQSLLGQLPPFAGHVLCLDRDAAMIAAHVTIDPPCRVTAENLAYVIYTSGSTGRPKGVAVPHRAVLRLLVAVEYVQLDARQTLLMLSPISFDASTFEVWGALLHGARCVIVRDRVPTIEALGEILERARVSTLWLTASLFNVLVDQAPQILRGVRQLLTGGEALSPAHIRAARQAVPEVQLINGYGPTESTTFACCYRIPAALDDAERTIPIGRPIANTRVYVLDRSLNPVPVGVPGELWIGGDGLARGYVNRPALTSEKFRCDPFSSARGARMYQTGDRVRYRTDGQLEFLGRFDDQVKIRGFRIEPGEVEAVLAQHPDVGQVTVLTREDIPGEKRLVAYVVRTDTAAIDVESLRAFVRDRLPEYMHPSAYVALDHLPLSPNGKIDRKALPAPQSATRAQATIVWPANPTEKQLVHIWQDLLHVRPVGVTDNFFELGGHSLLAVRLMYEIEQACGRRLPLLTLFEGATIRQLARALLDRDTTSPAAPMTAIHPAGTRLPFFFLHGDFNGGGFYSVALARHLGADQPFYAIHPHGLDGREMRLTIEAMAEDHLATVRAVQPKGPYRLGGHCNGGLIALEMARRLNADGERVDLLAVLDAPVLAAETGPVPDDEIQKPAGTPLGQAYLRAMSTYVPHRFEGPVTLFYAGTQPDPDLEGAWQALANELRVFRIPGNHMNFITRDVHVLGEQLRACLEGVQRDGGTT